MYSIELVVRKSILALLGVYLVALSLFVLETDFRLYSRWYFVFREDWRKPKETFWDGQICCLQVQNLHMQRPTLWSFSDIISKSGSETGHEAFNDTFAITEVL